MTPSQASSLEDLFADLLQQQAESAESLPPVHLWNPQLSGVMDMRIDREGRWIHEGGEIKRQPLVKLFSRILRRGRELFFANARRKMADSSRCGTILYCVCDKGDSRLSAGHSAQHIHR